MEPSPGLALCFVVVIWDLAGTQEREIELDTALKSAAGAFQVRSSIPADAAKSAKAHQTNQKSRKMIQIGTNLAKYTKMMQNDSNLAK